MRLLPAILLIAAACGGDPYHAASLASPPPACNSADAPAPADLVSPPDGGGDCAREGEACSAELPCCIILECCAEDCVDGVCIISR